MAPHLTALAVKDLALVSALELELGAGLTVLTGETGAGKSMLVDVPRRRRSRGRRTRARGRREGAGGRHVRGDGRPRVAALLGERDLPTPARTFSSFRRSRPVARRRGSTGRACRFRSSPRSATRSRSSTAGRAIAAGATGVQRDLLDAYGRNGEQRERTAERAGVLAALRRQRAALGGDPRERAARRPPRARGPRIEEARIREGRTTSAATSRSRAGGAPPRRRRVGARSPRRRAPRGATTASRWPRASSRSRPSSPASRRDRARVAAQVEETADLGPSSTLRGVRGGDLGAARGARRARRAARRARRKYGARSPR